MTSSIGLIVRVAIRPALIAYAVPIGFTATAWIWIGIVPLAIAMFSFRPLNLLIGVSTCPVKWTE